jgi:putative SOS response-associated peptidase YedK
MFAAIRHRRPAPRPAEVGLAALLDQGPSKARRPINARSETAAKLGMFKHALARRRCLVPADAFYEWKVVEGGKQPYAIGDRPSRSVCNPGPAPPD